MRRFDASDASDAFDASARVSCCNNRNITPNRFIKRDTP
jgi:hypothetical protein